MSAGSSPRRIGFVGLGAVGGPMARRIVQAGHHLSVYDISPPAVDALAEAGAEVVGVAVLADRGARPAVTGRGLIYRAAYELADLGIS